MNDDDIAERQRALLADLHRRAQRDGMEVEVAIMRQGATVFIVSRHEAPEVRRLIDRARQQVARDVDARVEIDLKRDGDLS